MPSRSPVHVTNFSTYAGIVLWGVVSFGIQPTFGAFFVHFLITPVVIVGLIALCHWEGRSQMERQRLEQREDEPMTQRHGS